MKTSKSFLGVGSFTINSDVNDIWRRKQMQHFHLLIALELSWRWELISSGKIQKFQRVIESTRSFSLSLIRRILKRSKVSWMEEELNKSFTRKFLNLYYHRTLYERWKKNKNEKNGKSLKLLNWFSTSGSFLIGIKKLFSSLSLLYPSDNEATLKIFLCIIFSAISSSYRFKLGINDIARSIYKRRRGKLLWSPTHK